MTANSYSRIDFKKDTVSAGFTGPDGHSVQTTIEIRTNPVTWRTSRIALSRKDETEPGTGRLPDPPPDANDTNHCPFCESNVFSRTPAIQESVAGTDRLINGDSVLFPNLYPYGAWSAVSLIGGGHFVEIGTAAVASYTESLVNSGRYLNHVIAYDPCAVYMAVTQNHLPSAGGSLVHPHFQINADRIPANCQRFLVERSNRYYELTGSYLFSDYLAQERDDGSRYIGRTGDWEWIAAYAPEGFFEIWGILPGAVSVPDLTGVQWADLAQGIINTQRFYRSLFRNGYNMGLLCFHDPDSRLECRAVLMVRSNYAPWVRNDHTGFEVMLGDMTTFVPPEQTARSAACFWNGHSSESHNQGDFT